MSHQIRTQLTQQLGAYLAIEGILAEWLEAKLISMTEYNATADSIFFLIDDERVEAIEAELRN